MAWALLIVSGMLEAVWVVALGESRGFRRLVPSLVTVVFAALSAIGLGIAMVDISTGTAYAVWVAIGAATTVLATKIRSRDASITPVLWILGLVGCVVGLKFAG